MASQSRALPSIVLGVTDYWDPDPLYTRAGGRTGESSADPPRFGASQAADMPGDPLLAAEPDTTTEPTRCPDSDQPLAGSAGRH